MLQRYVCTGMGENPIPVETSKQLNLGTMKTTAEFEEVRKDQESLVSTPPQTPEPALPLAEASAFAQKELVKRECASIINKYKKIQNHGY